MVPCSIKRVSEVSQTNLASTDSLKETRLVTPAATETRWFGKTGSSEYIRELEMEEAAIVFDRGLVRYLRHTVGSKAQQTNRTDR